MKLVAEILEKAIEAYKTEPDPKKKARIATRWFERNAEPTLGEIQKLIKEE